MSILIQGGMGVFDILIRGKGKEIRKTFRGEVVTIGRRLGHDIHLEDPSVSKDHARIEERRKGCVLVDLGSSNGTCVNGEPIEKRLLKQGDIVSVGDVELVFLESSAPDLEKQLENTAEEMKRGVGYETMLARITKDLKDRDVAGVKGAAPGQDTQELMHRFIEMGWTPTEAKSLAEEAKGKPVSEIDESCILGVAKPKPSERVLQAARALPEAVAGRLVRFKGEEYFVAEAKQVGETWEYRLKRC